MKNRVTDATQQCVEFLSRVVCWLWETLDKLMDIFFDFLARLIELTLAVMNLIFQVICFLRDLWLEAMQTFANVFRGIVNVVRNITCDEVEDFALACIVVLLWIGFFRLVKNLIAVNARANLCRFVCQPHLPNTNSKLAVENEDCVCPVRRKTGRRAVRRNDKRSKIDPTYEKLDD